MDSSQPTYAELIDAYIEGKLSPEDAQKLMDCVASGEADEALEERFSKGWLEADEFLPTTERLSVQGSAQLFKSIATKINEETANARIGEKPGPVVNHFFKKWWSVAAAIITLLGISFFWKQTIDKQNNNLAASYALANYQRVINTTNTVLAVALQDGSTVTLSPGAELHYPDNLAALPERTVLLEGDAFFDIAHQDGKKFIVKASALTTEVLGTSFWIRQNTKQENHSVEVRSGKVKVTALLATEAPAEEGIIVLPNQQVSLKKGSNVFVKTLADDLLPLAITSEEDAAQHTNTFALDYVQPTPLKKILQDLEAMYGVKIEVQDSQMLQTLMSGNLTHIKLQNKLEVICLSIGAGYTIEADKVVLHN